jgi:hypothetical protein
VAYEFTPVSEAAYHTYQFARRKAIPKALGIIGWLRRRGYITAPEGVEIAFWPLARTFTLNRQTRQARINELEGYANKTIYYRDQSRRLAYELSVADACPHSSLILPYVCSDCYSDRIHPNKPEKNRVQ